MSNSNEEEGLHPKQQCLKPSENTSRPQALKNATLVFQQNIAAENNLDEAVANEPAQSQPSEFRSTPGMSCKDFDWAPQDHVDDLNAICCGMKNMDDYLDDGGDRRAFKWRLQSSCYRLPNLQRISIRISGATFQQRIRSRTSGSL